MSLDVQIRSGVGEGKHAKVTSDNALLVQNIAGSSSDVSEEELTRRKLLQAYFENSSSSDEMNVNGSVTTQEFYIGATPGRLNVVTRVRVILEGANFEMNKQDFRRFGNATTANTPLPNGIKLEMRQGGITTQYFTEPMVVSGDFFTYSQAFINQINAISATEDYLNFTFDFIEPISLPEGTTDEICFCIQDDLSSIFRFQAFASGYYEVL